MASKKPPPAEPAQPQQPTKPPKAPRPAKDGPVRTQMVGEHGDDDIGYDPATIPVQDIPED
jgi:hypothetical protein